MKLNLKKIISLGLAAVFVTASAVCMQVPAAAKQDYIMSYQTSYGEIYEGDPEKYFTMNGVSYTTGVKLTHIWVDDTECFFNLGGIYDLMTFDVGHIDGGDGSSRILKVYCNGEYKDEIALTGTMMTTQVSLNVSGVNQVQIVLSGSFARCDYGIANITAYDYDGAVSAGKTIPKLMSSSPVYRTELKAGYVSPYQVSWNNIAYTGDPEESFTMSGIDYTYGVVIRGGVGNGWSCFNLGGMFDSLTFDLGHIDGSSTGSTTLKVYCDEVFREEIPVSDSMYIMPVTINVSGLNQIRFEVEGEIFQYGLGNITAVHNHTWAEEKAVGAEPTCILAGEKAVYCLTCGEADPATVEVIPALGHNYVDNVCTRCGKPEKIIPSGDVNNDGATNSKDLTRLMKVVAGEMIDAVGGDINGDGVVNSKDLTRLMKFIAGAISELA